MNPMNVEAYVVFINVPDSLLAKAAQCVSSQTPGVACLQGRVPWSAVLRHSAPGPGHQRAAPGR